MTSDSLLRGIYWIFWIGVFTLAAAQLLYLVRGYSELGTALSLVVPAAFLEYYAGTLRTEKDAEAEHQLRSHQSFAKGALVWSGPTVFPVNDTRQLDEGLAFRKVIASTVGFDAYNGGSKGSYSDIVRELLPSEVYAYLGHVKELEKID
ncbi:hypothetical protein LAC81_30090 [Ensifer adhaerens]|uniref:hypothetical protein n=1 Tax=Ensifer adhaerens TaxID=106592 RepID=UPI001CBD7581|nr:hypothetical protein [Ensifer adhaerens]UAX95804.1 hypothetical protein LAC78_33740 [Ensifer adhaerens]UAY10287.1 hypothetical protein LAC81_30090 [Ensifer adhaerens]